MRIGLVLTALIFCAGAAAVRLSPVPLADWFSNPAASFALAQGENPAPIHLIRPDVEPLSAMALLGRKIFYDRSLSSSGRLACASCHDPRNFYGPRFAQDVVYGGPDLKRQGARAVPSLMYLNFQQKFTIGPDPAGDNDAPLPLPQLAAAGQTAQRATKTAQSTAASAANIVPQGGLFWDGRADTLQIQAMGPLLNPLEMDGGSIGRVATKLKSAPYAQDFTDLFGEGVLDNSNLLVAEAMFAVSRYQIEEQSFHPFTSKYDYWLEGRSRLSAAEMRGYQLFNDVSKGDCAACHLAQPTADGRPPAFTDTQYEALGVPRNPNIAFNSDPAYYDMGVCGPYRTDLARQTQFCGMFLTPTLRNVATRQVFMHNGIYHDLKQVMDFYDYRDVQPARIYPRDKNGQVAQFNDLPGKYRANIDHADPPFDRHAGQAPALSEAEENDIIAFLKTLTDGYKPDRR